MELHKLFIDDLRDPPGNGWIIARSATAAKLALAHGGIGFVSFDHDLGDDEDGTGYDVAAWIEEHAANGALPRISWTVHSANPVGRERIVMAMRSADKFWSMRGL